MDKFARQIAETALQIRAIRLQPEDPFTWASGYRMPIYNDNRLLLGNATTRTVVVDGFLSLLESEGLQAGRDFDVVAGTATAGIPWATSIADRLGLPLVYVREKPKTHGVKKRVEGPLAEGQRVIVIEDLISTGGSSVSALEGVREQGGKADYCFAIFSYGISEAAKQFENAHAKCRSILQFDDLLKVASEKGAISKEGQTLLSAWKSDPFGWGEKHGFPKVEKAA